MGENFGDNLREVRKKARLSQEAVASTIGVTKATVSNYENGGREPDIGRIIQLAKLFGISTDALLGMPASAPRRGQWLDMWIADKKSIVETMAKNMAADLEAGYSYYSRSIQEQKRALEEYDAEYGEQLMAFASMTDEETERWCYFDLLRRGAIERE